MRKSWLIACLINFCLAATMGVLLRYVYIAPLNINYAYLLHGHSHTAMLGWIYLMLYSFIFQYFIPKTPVLEKKYDRLFWVTQLSIIGMIISFPLQGYAVVSIFFSTLHIFCSYYFCYRVWKDKETKTIIEKKMLLTALFFMLFSTIGVWCLGPVATTGGKNSPFYQVAIQFFIHFQFNGWFLFGVLALLLHRIQKATFELDKPIFNWFYYSLVLSSILTFALPIGWYIQLPLLQYLNQLGILIQLISALAFFKLIAPHYKSFIETLRPISKRLYNFTLFILLLKTIIQSASFLPEIAVVSHEIRSFVIGFIHLSMLGLISGFLFSFISELKFVNFQNNMAKTGLYLFGIAFITTELLLFIQGGFLYKGMGGFSTYYKLLFMASLGLPIGLILLTYSLSTSLKSKI